MAKFSIILFIAVILCTTAGVASDKTTLQANPSKRDSEIPAPFPPLRPVDQAEYESSLPEMERTWLRLLQSRIEKHIQQENISFQNNSFSFGVDTKGIIVAPISFNGPLAGHQKEKIMKMIYGMSPVPTSTSYAQKAIRIMVNFDETSIRAIRLIR